MDSQTPQSNSTNECFGSLIVQVTTAQGAIPLEGARVDIRSYNPENALESGDIIASVRSGRDGNTPAVRLVSPPCTYADSPGGPKPYYLYQADVFLNGYYDQVYVGIPIYDGITVLQPAVMVPLPEDGSTDPSRETRYFETDQPDLL